MQNDFFCYIEPIEYIGTNCAVFDLDGCMIMNANGQKPGYTETKEDNYVFMYNVENIIWNLIRSGIQVVVITNQSNYNIAKDNMINLIYQHFDRRLLFFIANKHNEWRKPSSKFIDLLSNYFIVDYYCGDAVGDSDFLPYNWKSTDKDFAVNSRVPFKTPLEVFGTNFYSVVPQERLIIMMGIQGSGKTTVAKRLEEYGAIRYSSDEQANNLTAKFRINAIRQYLNQGHQVVVDATHSSNKSRQVWIDLATECNVDYHILWCIRDGRVFNELRTGKEKIPSLGFSTYVKNFERPSNNYTIIN